MKRFWIGFIIINLCISILFFSACGSDGGEDEAIEEVSSGDEPLELVSPKEDESLEKNNSNP